MEEPHWGEHDACCPIGCLEPHRTTQQPQSSIFSRRIHVAETVPPPQMNCSSDHRWAPRLQPAFSKTGFLNSPSQGISPHLWYPAGRGRLLTCLPAAPLTIYSEPKLPTGAPGGSDSRTEVDESRWLQQLQPPAAAPPGEVQPPQRRCPNRTWSSACTAVFTDGE